MINTELYNALKVLMLKLCQALAVSNKKRTGVLHSKYFTSKKALVLKWEEYNACTEIINNDKRIKELYNEFIYDGMYRFCFKNTFDVVSFFVLNYFEEYTSFNEEAFEAYYINFEFFIYERISYHIYNARLYNFINSNQVDINISETLMLKYEPLKSDNDNFNVASDYVLECVVEVKWIIQKSANVSIDDPFEKATISLNNFIKAIRLLKKTNIYRDEQIFQRTTNPAWVGRVIFNDSQQKPNMYGKEIGFTDSEYTELKHILKYIEQEKKMNKEKKDFRRFDVAITRLHYGIERYNFDDKLIDFMIALEAMYLPDGNSELTFRLSLRASLLLNDKGSAKNDFKFLRNMYDARSSIVHGNTSNISKDEIDKLEEIIRKSLKIWLYDDSLFNVENLNNIFFK